MRFRRRLLILYALFGGALLILWGRVCWMQTVEGAHWDAHARRMRQVPRTLEATRGRILDRAGRVLAHDEPALQLCLVPWDYGHRARGRCATCGLVHFQGARSRLPARCVCVRSGGAAAAGGSESAGRIESLPPQDSGPLEAALGLRPGDLDRLARQRQEEIDRMCEAYRRRLGDSDGLDFFVEDMVRSRRQDLMRRPTVLVSRIADEAARLVLLDETGEFRGFRVQSDLRRKHPLGGVSSRLIGYVSKIRDEEEYDRLKGERGQGSLTRDSRIGRRGVERALNWVLHGCPGMQRLERDHNGSFTVVAEEVAARPGVDVHLSLDAEMSRAAQEILSEVATTEGYAPGARPSGAFVMLDAVTGEILVWAEIPTLDFARDLERLYDRRFIEALPGEVAGTWDPAHLPLPDGMDLETWRAELSVPAPLALSRVGQIAVEPGSTFKPLVSLALLATGHLTPESTYTCVPGSERFPRCRGCGTLDLHGALTRSCNRYFAHFLRDADQTPWEARRVDLGAFLQTLGLGQTPNPAFGEWASGTWLREGYDFSLTELLSQIQRDLAAKPTLAGTQPAIDVEFLLAGDCPDTVGGQPESIRTTLQHAIEHVARASGRSKVRVAAALIERRDEQVAIRFEVRPRGVAPWFALPGLGVARVPAQWRHAIEAGRLGVSGNPARSGAIWLRAVFERGLSRTDPDAPPVLHPHDGRSVAIGQGPVLVTPLQMARAVALVANGKTLVTPHAATRIGDHPHQVPGQAVALDSATLAAIRDGMRSVVEDPHGTANRAGFDSIPVTVYGKTGTAQLGRSWRPWTRQEEAGSWHHWFVGFAETPDSHPLAMACVMHARVEAGSALTAAVAAAKILKRWVSP